MKKIVEGLYGHNALLFSLLIVSERQRVLAQTEKRENGYDHHNQSDEINYRVHCQVSGIIENKWKSRDAPALFVKRLSLNLVPRQLWLWIWAAHFNGTGAKTVGRRLPPLKC